MRMFRKNKKGFTLVELILVIVLSGIIFLALSQGVIITIRAWDIALSGTNVITKSEANFSKMSREIRQVKNRYNLITASASDIRFIDVDDNDVEYRLSGSQLLRNSRAAIDNVTSLSFVYLDRNGNTIATPIVSPSGTDVRMVLITATIGSGNQSLTTQTLVRFRNVR